MPWPDGHSTDLDIYRVLARTVLELAVDRGDLDETTLQRFKVSVGLMQPGSQGGSVLKTDEWSRRTVCKGRKNAMPLNRFALNIHQIYLSRNFRLK